MTDPFCSVIIPVYNACFYTRLCLDSLRRTVLAEPPYELIVVDNGSTDDTRSVLEQYGDVVSRVITNPANLGFAMATNQGARAARGRYLVFLNNDIVVDAGWLTALFKTAEGDPTIGVVGARLLYPDDTIQHAGVGFLPGPVPFHFFKGHPGDWPAALEPRECQAVTGACMLVERQLFEDLGGLDEMYRNSFEDIDLCFKVRQGGRRVVYCPHATGHHFESSTPGRLHGDEGNLATFRERWGSVVTVDADQSPQASRAMAGPASVMRLEWERLATENARLRSLVSNRPESNRAAPPTPQRLTERLRAYDLIYQPARPSTAVAGRPTSVPVVIENVGSTGWPAGQLRLGYHWRRSGSTDYLLWNGLAAVIGEPVAPGSRVLVRSTVTMPDTPGEYVLEWDALEDGVAWMSDHDVTCFRQNVRVESPSSLKAAVHGMPTTLKAGEPITVETVLRGSPDPALTREPCLLARWLTLDGEAARVQRPALSSARNGAPGEASVLTLSLLAPVQAGVYHLQLAEWNEANEWAWLETSGGEVFVVAGEDQNPSGDGDSPEIPVNWQARAEEAEYLIARAQRQSIMPQPAGLPARPRSGGSATSRFYSIIRSAFDGLGKRRGSER